MSRWLKDDASKSAIYLRDWMKTEKGQIYREKSIERSKQWRIDNKEKFQSKKKENNDKVHLEVFNHYSNGKMECACPGCDVSEILFLTIDHIEGNGQKHRAIKGNADIYYWLKKNNLPEGFQVLCMNCNFAKKKNLYCPVHQPKLYKEFREENPESYNHGMIGKNHPGAQNYLITLPNGKKQTILNLAEFCRENNLNRYNMYRVISGQYKQHKGFKCEKVLTATA